MTSLRDSARIAALEARCSKLEQQVQELMRRLEQPQRQGKAA